MLLSSGADHNICIFTLDGDLVGHLNINYPLPIVWKIHFDNETMLKNDIMEVKQVV